MRKFGGRHTFMHWVDGGSQVLVDRCLADLGSALGLPSGAPRSAVWHALTRYRDWLLVIDSVPRDGLPPLPPRGRGAVVVTTGRAHAELRHLGPVVRLGPLTEREITDHILTLVGDLRPRDPGTAAALRRLVERLPSNPERLALLDLRGLLLEELAAAGDGAEPDPDPPDRAGGNGSADGAEAARGQRPAAGHPGSGPVAAWPDAGATQGLAGAVDPNGDLVIATVNDEGAVQLLLPYSELLLGHHGRVRALALFHRSPGGDLLLAVAHTGTKVTVRDAYSGRLRTAIDVPLVAPEGRITPEPGTEALAVATGVGVGPVLVTAGRDTPVRLWAATTGEPVAPVPGRGFRTPALTVFTSDADGRALVAFTDTQGRTGSVQDLMTGRRATSPLGRRLGGAVALATVAVPGQPDVVAAAGPGLGVRFWDSATGRSVGWIDTGPGSVRALCAVAGSADRPLLATADADGGVRLWDLSRRAENPVPPPAPRTGGAVRAVARPHPRRGPGPDRPGAGPAAVPGQRTRPGVPRPLAAAAGRGLLVETGESAEYPLTVVTLLPHHVAYLAQTLTDDERRAFEGRLFRTLLDVCWEPTADPRTWTAYDALDPFLPPYLADLLDAPAGGRADPVSLLLLVARWGKARLLYGDPVQGDRLIGLAESWSLRADRIGEREFGPS